ncbi:MAG: NADH-quinone oxidoreductase subunit L [Anaerolineales bacterium]
MQTELLIIWLLPLPPLLAFFLILLFTNRSKWLSHSLALLAAFLSFAGSMFVIIQAAQIEHFGEHPFESIINWLPLGDGWFQGGVLVDPLSAVTLFFVAWTILMIFLYSVGYHNFGQPKGDHDQPGLPPHGATVVDEHGHTHNVPSIEPMYSRFFAFFGLFAAGMYLLVVANNLLWMFVGWEIMGLCSYLLIGFWFQKPSARAAAIKAFMTTRVGDVFMLLGIAFLYSATGTLNFREILYNQEVLHILGETSSGFLGLSVAGLIGLLLFIGTVGKSAQFPLHVWLPDAMEGPTPVSAMIHAATMVSAGIYAILRMFPLITADFHGHGLTPLMAIIATIGAFTALFSATIAVAQNDIKRVLAYSTISQLGFMVASVGIGAFVAAAFHLLTHAFFKALLFLGSGSVIHGMEHGLLHTNNHEVDPQDMYNMGGLRKKMPITFWTFLIGGFTLAGFPIITAGFWSKDEILADAFIHAPAVFWTLALAALLTAFYTMRQITLTFLSEPRTAEAEHAHETKWTMTVPLIVLSVFAIGLGWIGVPEHFPLLGGVLPEFFQEFAAGALLQRPEMPPFNWMPLLTSVVVSIGGLLAGWLIYRNVKAGETDPLKRWLGGVFTLLQRKYYIDEIYQVVFVRPSIWISETLVSQIIDRNIIDGILHFLAYISSLIGSFFRNAIDNPIINGFGDLMGEGTKRIGNSVRVIQTGKIQQYMTIALIIIFGVLVFFISSLALP